MNHYLMANGSTPPIVAYSGAQPGTLYTGPVTVNLSINAANRGLAGYSASNFADPKDPASQATPKTPSSGPNPFWDGPSVIGKSSGSMRAAIPSICGPGTISAWGTGTPTPALGPSAWGRPARFAISRSAAVCRAAIRLSVTMDFSVDGTFVSASTVYNGQEQQAHQYTYVNACLPGTSNCQGFNTSESQVCPISGGGGGGGGGGGLTCTSCEGEKYCPNPDGGKGTICVSKSLPSPVIH